MYKRQFKRSRRTGRTGPRCDNTWHDMGILISCHGTPRKWLRHCIKTLVGQTLKPLVIFVNDKPGTQPHHVRNFIKKDLPLMQKLGKIIYTTSEYDTVGGGHGYNVAMKTAIDAGCRYMMMMGSDDWFYTPVHIAGLHKIMVEDNAILVEKWNETNPNHQIKEFDYWHPGTLMAYEATKKIGYNDNIYHTLIMRTDRILALWPSGRPFLENRERGVDGPMMDCYHEHFPYGMKLPHPQCTAYVYRHHGHNMSRTSEGKLLDEKTSKGDDIDEYPHNPEIPRIRPDQNVGTGPSEDDGGNETACSGDNQGSPDANL